MALRHDISGWDIIFDATQAARYRADGLWLDRTIADDARDRAVLEPDRVCLHDQLGSLTYREALEQAEAIAAGLWDLGLRPGDVASFQLPNWNEAAVINLAVALIGVVANPIVPIYRDKEVADILRDCRARVAFIPEKWRGFDYSAMIARLRAELPDLAHVVLVRSNSAETPPNFIRYEALSNASTAAMDWPAQNPDAVKFILYTSGTTGRAKGVLHSHNTLSRALLGCTEYWRVVAGEAILMPSPVSHVTGYLFGLEAPFSNGNMAVLMERWVPDEAIDLINRHRVVLTVSATPFLTELLDAAEARGAKLPSLRIFGCGGAAVPASLIRRANAFLAPGRAFRVYGATEALMIGKGCMEADDLDSAAETDGKIIDYDVRVVDEHGHEAPDGVEGEILARGAAASVGYADRAETEAAFDAEGFFRTGDLGIRTPRGAVVITGRKKDLIIRGGQNISAKEIEDILLTHPGVREVAAVAMPHKRLGETVCAFVIPSGDAPSLVDLTRHLDVAGVAKQKLPERLELLEDFPRTPAGKVKKDLLRALVARRLAEEDQARADRLA